MADLNDRGLNGTTAQRPGKSMKPVEGFTLGKVDLPASGVESMIGFTPLCYRFI
jgi:hypothetical protein